jgi:hypothetical protein
MVLSNSFTLLPVEFFWRFPRLTGLRGEIIKLQILRSLNDTYFNELAGTYFSQIIRPLGLASRLAAAIHLD